MICPEFVLLLSVVVLAHIKIQEVQAQALIAWPTMVANTRFNFIVLL